MKKLKQQNGITLVALVITIVILLILTGISIQAITNQGIFAQTEEAKKKTENAQIKEEETLADYETAIGEYVEGTREQITVDKEEYQTLKDIVNNSVEKVDTISTTPLCYANQTLNFDFSKYKKIRCYAEFGANCSVVFDIDISGNHNIEEGYRGSALGHSSKANIETYIFAVNASINTEKTLLTMEKIGYLNGTTWIDRFTSEYSKSGWYSIYKIEGIY